MMLRSEAVTVKTGPKVRVTQSQLAFVGKMMLTTQSSTDL